MTCVLAQAKNAGRVVETVILLVAGNDLDRERGSSAEHVQYIIDCVDELRLEWARAGVEIRRIDAVPRSYHLV